MNLKDLHLLLKDFLSFLKLSNEWEWDDCFDTVFFSWKGSIPMNSDNCWSYLIECNMTKKGIAQCGFDRKLWICSEQKKITKLLNYLHNIMEWITFLITHYGVNQICHYTFWSEPNFLDMHYKRNNTYCYT